jgi:hypothetical protein
MRASIAYSLEPNIADECDTINYHRKAFPVWQVVGFSIGGC